MSQLFTMGEVQAYSENENAESSSKRVPLRSKTTDGGNQASFARAKAPVVIPYSDRRARNAVPSAGRAGGNIKKGVGEMVQYTTRTGKKAFRRVGLYAKRGGRMAMKGAQGGGNLAMRGAKAGGRMAVRGAVGGAILAGQGAVAVGKNVGRYPGRYGAAAGIAAAGAGGYYLSGRD